ncbi:PUA-like domain-containing protein [Suillus paluster]|uniref:PUA-like domain-containing protein n=1 Tax=Suillus paluster TaxID=48578 RepID=UPI001B8825E3|nr:PUA-like domain-containing protein [Suillus paluster]KAG1752512.1 PUA-like domain-containing protein [Suillus paluster]
MTSTDRKYWLMKAEPDSRIVKGKDVKFSVDDFEAVRTTPWEGVRNFEARNLMKEMSLGDKILFYHSNCKNPGIAGFAEVSKEAYPDYTAWDSSHPYFDPKTKRDDPKWFMIDATFLSRAEHFVPLSLLRHIADSDPPDEIAYIGTEGVKAMKAMPLVTRGRLSVQRVSEECWGIIQMMTEKGGWEGMTFGKTKSGTSNRPRQPTKNSRAIQKKTPTRDNGGDEVEAEVGADDEAEVKPKKGKKRKASDIDTETQEVPRRRSLRTKEA